MRRPVIIDVETKYSFREQPDTKKLGISVAALYDYNTDKYEVFEEDDLQKYFSYLEHSSLIIGFNIVSFDMIVLSSYYPGKLESLETFDLLEDIKKKTGKRYALNDLLNETLQKKKTGHGLQAINLFRNGKIEELSRYCIDDVKLTKELFEYGVEHSKVYYPSPYGKKHIFVEWDKKINTVFKTDNNVSLTLPF